jgi:uncharacterized protein (TIGR03437 family)
VISGTTSLSGSFSVTVTATDNTGLTGTQAYNLTVNVNGGLVLQTINFPPIPDHLGPDAPFTISATASSGLPVTFTVLNGPATISGSTVTITGLGQVTIQASQAGNGTFAAATATQTFNVKLGAPTITAVENAATMKTGPIAPGSFASVFGNNFGSGSVIGNDAVSQTLDGVTLTIKDAGGAMYTANLSYVGYRQVNFIVPDSLATGPATLTLANSAGSASATLMIQPVAPGIFTADQSGSGVPAGTFLLISSDGSSRYVSTYTCVLSCSPLPVQISGTKQAYLILYGTDIHHASGLSGVSATIGGVVATVTYAGPQGTFLGLDQINILIPPSLAGSGTANVIVTVDGVPSNTVKVAFQ